MQIGADVLVVDDDDGVRLLFLGILEDEGCEVRAAADGLDALDRCSERLPDLILLDLQMPRLDGVGFLEALHTRG